MLLVFTFFTAIIITVLMLGYLLFFGFKIGKIPIIGPLFNYLAIGLIFFSWLSVLLATYVMNALFWTIFAVVCIGLLEWRTKFLTKLLKRKK